MKKLKIYVAGPYTPDTTDIHDAARIAHQNTRKAIEIGIKIMKLGHIPFIPHLTHYIHLETDESLPYNVYTEYDFEWLKNCDALFYISSSKGADKELEYAEKQGLRIFYQLSEIPIYS